MTIYNRTTNKSMMSLDPITKFDSPH